MVRSNIQAKNRERIGATWSGGSSVIIGTDVGVAVALAGPQAATKTARIVALRKICASSLDLL